MIKLKKLPDSDFVILNLSDIQLDNDELLEGHLCRKIFDYTLNQLIDKVKPNLITLSGDLSWAGYDYAYETLANEMEKLGVPWAPVWGNHDNQLGAEYIDKIATSYLEKPHCVYEKGERELGNGNYLILIEEEGRIVSAIIMMDTHDKEEFISSNGEKQESWAKLNDKQIKWYLEQVQFLKEQGCSDATIVLHIPIYAYNYASIAAYKNPDKLKTMTVEESYSADSWNEGYKNSVGVQHEDGVSSFCADDGVFDAIEKGGVTKRILAGHDHLNNFIIRYKGIDFAYSLKMGAGCYWESCLNGGTVITIGRNGENKIYHEYVDVSHLLSK